MAAAIRLSQQHSCSFDHLVGEREQSVRNLEAKRLRGREIDDQLELGGLLNWKIGRLVTSENPADIGPSLAIGRSDARSIADEAAGCRKNPPSINCGYRMTGGHLYELLPPTIEECVVADHERAGVQLHEGCKSGVDLAFGTCLHDMQLDPLCACRLLRLSHHLVGTRIVWVHEQGDLPGLGNQFG